MFQKRQRRKFKPLLYTLQRTYGVPAELHRFVKIEPNYETGGHGSEKVIIKIPRLVTLTSATRTETERTLSVLSAGRDFVFGGFFDISDRIMVHVTDEDLKLTLKDYYVYDDQRWEIVRFTRLDFNMGYIVATRSTQNESISNF